MIPEPVVIDAEEQRRAHLARGAVVVTAVLVALLFATGSAWRHFHDRNLVVAWQASSAWGVYSDHGDLSGARPGGLLFHTEEQESPSVVFDLGSLRAIHELRVVNRRDLRERAVPLVAQVSTDGTSWAPLAHRDDTFDEWDVTFASRAAHYVKLIVPRRTCLHLADVQVH